MKDERIMQAENKIRSEIAVIIYIGIILSYLVKTLIFNMDPQECITEYVVIAFFPIYQFIRMHMMKISLNSKRGNKQAVITLMTTIIIVLIASVILIFRSISESDTYLWQNSVFRMIVFLGLFITIFFMANRYNRYRGNKYEKEFDDK